MLRGKYSTRTHTARVEPGIEMKKGNIKVNTYHFDYMTHSFEPETIWYAIMFE